MTRAPRALAAAVTPLSHDGNAVDVAGIEPLTAFYAASGLDGLLVLGTTGEGVLLSPDERREAARTFVGFAPPRLAIIVHCGAQSTRDTVRLAEHAVEDGAAGVAVIAPPYYALDEAGLERHFVAAAHAADPLPFYVYEFAARSGYAVPLAIIERLRAQAPNLAGLKVSDAPFERVEPYLLPGLDVFVGAEELIHLGLQHGAAGAVSGLAAALPEVTVRAVRSGSAADAVEAGRVRALVQRFPFQAALKRILARRGVAIEPAVRAPLRDLDATEIAEFDGLLAELEELRLTGPPSPL
ncbi:MAG: dihydrodipicolinate synthase family protein [Candidatus Dormibacteraeota bacterium]|nr:dihydrodipicolinate synthase family protein [Candidatus Dormibacteraeota bacterium]